MFELPVKNMDGKDVASFTVEDGAFGPTVRKRLLHQAVVTYQANKRQGTVLARPRSMVAGSNKKPWRQKGTGRARAGSVKSPIWRGGGVIHGPEPRSFRKKMSKQMRRKALASAILAKLIDDEVLLLDEFTLPNGPKTKIAAQTLKKLGVEGRALVGVAEYDRDVYKSFRNIEDVTCLPVSDFNALEVMLGRKLVLTVEALERLIAAHSDVVEEQA